MSESKKEEVNKEKIDKDEVLKKDEEIKKQNNNKQNEEQRKKEEFEKMAKKEQGFFRKIYNSIFKIEKYPDMSSQGFPKALSYLGKLVAIFTIVVCLGIVFQTQKSIQQGVNYLENSFPNFSYKDGILNVESEEAIIIDEPPIAEKIIIDTKTEDANKINEYINQLEKAGDGAILLKDKIILKNISVAGTINYNYKEILSQMNISDFTKQDVINFANSSEIYKLYISLFITMFLYAFIMYFLAAMVDVFLISIFGYLSTKLARLRIRYVAIYNMAIYGLTLSILLNIIYVAINIFVDFNIEYFQVMYIAIPVIYVIAAIFILKSEFIKKQQELLKIAQVEATIREKEEQEKEKDKEQKEKEERREKDKKEEKNKDKEEKGDKQEPEGSNA